MGGFETILILISVFVGLLFLLTMAAIYSFLFYSSFKTTILEMKHDFQSGSEIVNKRHKK